MAERNMYISNRSKKLKPLSITLTKNQGSKIVKEEQKPAQNNNEEVKQPEPEPTKEEAKEPQDEEVEEGQ